MMNSQEIREVIVHDRIIAIVRGVESTRIVEAVGALLRGGIRLVEVTLDQSGEERIRDSLESIRLVSREFAGKVYPGVGTVLTTSQASRAVSAGARYIVSPDVNPAVIHRTKRLGAVSLPGAFTATEIAAASTAGADFVKLFPASTLGVDYVKAVLAPLSHVRLIAVGGVDLENIPGFLRAGVVGFGIGGNLVDRKLVARGAWDELEARARAFLGAATEA